MMGAHRCCRVRAGNRGEKGRGGLWQNIAQGLEVEWFCTVLYDLGTRAH
jgi:hypothetical protein